MHSWLAGSPPPVHLPGRPCSPVASGQGSWADASPLKARSALLLDKKQDKHDSFGGFWGTQGSRCLLTPPGCSGEHLCALG